MTRIFVISILFALAACAPAGHGDPDIAVQGWARETAPGQSVAAAYLTIENSGPGTDRLVGVASPAAEQASLHSTTVEDGIARMRAINGGLEIPARGAAALEPGGDHIMLVGLRQPLVRGSDVELQLRFERSGERQVAVRVLEPGASPEPHEGH